MSSWPQASGSGGLRLCRGCRPPPPTDCRTDGGSDERGVRQAIHRCEAVVVRPLFGGLPLGRGLGESPAAGSTRGVGSARTTTRLDSRVRSTETLRRAANGERDSGRELHPTRLTRLDSMSMLCVCSVYAVCMLCTCYVQAVYMVCVC